MYMTDERPVGVPRRRARRPRPPRRARRSTASSPPCAAMASQTASLMATLDPDIYAAQVAEEAFVDAAPPANPRPRARRAATLG